MTDGGPTVGVVNARVVVFGVESSLCRLFGYAEEPTQVGRLVGPGKSRTRDGTRDGRHRGTVRWVETLVSLLRPGPSVALTV